MTYPDDDRPLVRVHRTRPDWAGDADTEDVPAEDLPAAQHWDERHWRPA